MNNGKSRLIIVSNRLPFELKEDDGNLIVKAGSGGLVTALAPILRDRGGTWIGSIGTVDADDDRVSSCINKAGASAGYLFSPVFLTAEEQKLYYDGFSNEIIWPLFHDMPMQCNFVPKYWQAYQTVNAKFAEKICSCVSPEDFIWVHDYHLMLLGQELRKKNIQAKIGFFLHIPFPSPDLFIKLPWRLELIRALLDFDLVGFQTLRDRRNFIQCVRLLLRETPIQNLRSLHICKKEHREVRVGNFPISIDYKEFGKKSSSKEIAEGAWLLHEKWPNQKLILSVDRLDYSKGIPQRLEAISSFLKQYPEFHKQVSFIQVVVPSRVEIPKYQELKKEIDQLVSEINSAYAKENWTPINYFFRSLTREELLAYYRTSEIALVTPLKDGMNLVCKEYLACKIENDGALILSEFAGAASQLNEGAILVNPYDINGIAQALDTALTMHAEEKKKRIRSMRRVIKRYDVFWWTKMFLSAAFAKDLRDFPITKENEFFTTEITEREQSLQREHMQPVKVP